MIYTTYGKTRGSCGHRHTTFGAAEACRARDQSGCAAQGGYSDRIIAEVRRGRLYLLGGGADDWIPGPGGRSCGAARL